MMEKMEEMSFQEEPIVDSTVSNENVIEEIKDVVEEPNISSVSNVEEKVEQQPVKSSSNFDSLFENLYSDVAGANNFISNLIEQKKNVGLNEAFLEEEKVKLDKAKKEFEEYINSQ